MSNKLCGLCSSKPEHGEKSSSRKGVMLALKKVLRLIRFIKLKRKRLSPLSFVELLAHSLFQQFTQKSQSVNIF
jgi:hypothetical protein